MVGVEREGPGKAAVELGSGAVKKVEDDAGGAEVVRIPRCGI